MLRGSVVPTRHTTTSITPVIIYDWWNTPDTHTHFEKTSWKEATEVGDYPKDVYVFIPLRPNHVV